MNKSVEEILRESREKRSKTLEIKKLNKTSDVEMKDYSSKPKNIRNSERKKNFNGRFDQSNKFKQNKFKNRRSFILEKRRNRIKTVNKSARLYVSNLNLDTTNSDLKTLFESIGPLKRCGINWNELGQSKGSADVEFFNDQHANEAKNKFNSGTLRGVPIKIQWARSNKNEDNNIERGIKERDGRDKNSFRSRKKLRITRKYK